eukprot:TRINITY_DN20299_c0_g1_i1.p1 TRINITY_DN20299_c0_g1~~TRINITY_DN20299_c0_g1_i1.p1  ORF type:complete len:278 (-),score=23.52 TRINITY_DN20299_c0_g1_i1:537-1304(-)
MAPSSPVVLHYGGLKVYVNDLSTLPKVLAALRCDAADALSSSSNDAQLSRSTTISDASSCLSRNAEVPDAGNVEVQTQPSLSEHDCQTEVSGDILCASEVHDLLASRATDMNTIADSCAKEYAKQYEAQIAMKFEAQFTQRYDALHKKYQTQIEAIVVQRDLILGKFDSLMTKYTNLLASRKLNVLEPLHGDQVQDEGRVPAQGADGSSDLVTESATSVGWADDSPGLSSDDARSHHYVHNVLKNKMRNKKRSER